MSQKLANATALYLEGIRDGNVRTAVEAYTGDRYTQHRTGVADGVEGFVEFFDPFVTNNPVRDIQVVRSIVDANYVFVHVYQDINDGEARWVTTDLFDTDDNDKITGSTRSELCVHRHLHPTQPTRRRRDRGLPRIHGRPRQDRHLQRHLQAHRAR